MKKYDAKTEQTMKGFYGTLSEKDRRRYAAVEALKLGRGGISYISQLLGCTRQTVYQGIEEVSSLPADSPPESRVRQPGAGRKQIAESYPDIDEKFLRVLKDHTAGDPMDERVLWTDLSQREIADKLAQEHQIQVSEPIIGQLLTKHNYRKRQAQKKRR